MSLPLPTKQQTTSSLSEKDTTWKFWRRNWILRVHMYLLSWRKTNFFCVISILSLNLISKLTNLTCLHFIGLPKLHKNPYKSRFISNSSHCSTTILSKHITSALTAVKDHVIKYSETAFNNSNVNYFWSIKNSSEVIEKLRLRNFQGSQVSSVDFSTLYTSLPHDLIKAKVLSLVKWCFDRESKTYLCTSAKAGFFSNKKYDSYACCTCTELCEAFTFLMENIYVQFDGMVYQQIVGIPMGTNCAPLIADLFLYCYERDFMSNLQKSKRFDLIDKFNDTSRYLDDIFTIDNPTFAEHIPDFASAKFSGFSSIFFRFFYFIHILAAWSHQSKSVVSC